MSGVFVFSFCRIESILQYSAGLQGQDVHNLDVLLATCWSLDRNIWQHCTFVTCSYHLYKISVHSTIIDELVLFRFFLKSRRPLGHDHVPFDDWTASEAISWRTSVSSTLASRQIRNVKKCFFLSKRVSSFPTFFSFKISWVQWHFTEHSWWLFSFRVLSPSA